MKRIFTLLLFASILTAGQSQILFEEDFESISPPADWKIETKATDGGWRFNTNTALSSRFWSVPTSGSRRIAATNDDACNCDKSDDLLIMPALDLSGVEKVVVAFDAFYGNGTSQGVTEAATIEVSLTGTGDWKVIKTMAGNGEWSLNVVDLTDYAGETQVFVGFRYSDKGGYLYGMAIDNVIVRVPLTTDVVLNELSIKDFAEQGDVIEIAGSLFNNGTETINRFEVAYTVDGGAEEVALIDNLVIPPFTNYDFVHPQSWIAGAKKVYQLEVAIKNINDLADEAEENNKLSKEIEIFNKITTVNRVDDYLVGPPLKNVVLTEDDGLDKPTDIDYYPILEKNQMWVINERTEGSGGSTITIDQPGEADMGMVELVDGNAWHFMSLPTALAFGENGNWASSPGVRDANHGGGTFTGPSLWSGDLSIYAQPSGGNGSHLDMLHGSPYSMGIAHEVDNVYWVFDGFNRELVRYDFQDDHGPGNDDHSDAIVRRVKDFRVARRLSIPSHMVLDKATGWLYFNDVGNSRVMRLDINSGGVSGSLALINEQLAEHSSLRNMEWETVVEDDIISRPSGIELIENRLLVGDYETGIIFVYDLDNNFEKIGEIPTGEEGLCGIKIGPDGAIWYVNRLQNILVKAEPGQPLSTNDPYLDANIHLSPNPTNGVLRVHMNGGLKIEDFDIQLSDLSGKTLLSTRLSANNTNLNLANFTNGMYLVTLSNDQMTTTKKIVVGSSN